MKQARRINYCLLLSVFHVFRRKSISTFLIEPTDSKEKQEEALFCKGYFRQSSRLHFVPFPFLSTPFTYMAIIEIRLISLHKNPNRLLVS